mmetsp:Transcript_13371/g.42927  ORF Transcript_13371/g.42927 Transcript_13371/m.42927 type:complete len:232 (-) Transcript_13371:14-709(-)
MQKEYAPVVDHVVPQCEELILTFRAAGLPIVWTNWAHRASDGWYSAADRVLGPRGVAARTNVNFIYTDDGAETISELAPISEVERGREIMSAHANKFADRDASGAPILYPMLQSLGVDTVVVVGAWTDFCVLATVIAAVDTWGFDTVVPTDAIASAMAISDDTAHSGLDIINLFALTRRTHEVLDFMKTRPELVVPPLTEDDAYNAAEAERSAPFFRSGAHRAAFRRDSAH